MGIYIFFKPGLDKCKMLCSLGYLYVILHLFYWREVKDHPDEQDMMFLFTSKYTIRVNAHRKVIEYAAHDSGVDTTNEEEGGSAKSQNQWSKEPLTIHIVKLHIETIYINILLDTVDLGQLLVVIAQFSW